MYINQSTAGKKLSYSAYTAVNSPRSYTSRPTNTSVLYCIKYEPTYYMNIYGLRTETVLFEGELVTGSVTLSDSIEKYDELLVRCGLKETDTHFSNHLVKPKEVIYALKYQFVFVCAGNGNNFADNTIYCQFTDTNTLLVDINANANNKFKISSIIGIKYGTTTERGNTNV